MMKSRTRFFVLYFGMMAAFILRYFLTTQIKMYEMGIIDSILIWLWFLRNAIDAFYYVIVLLLLLGLCRTDWLKLHWEVVFLMLPALILLVSGIMIIEPFAWMFTNSVYCIPFGAMLLCAFLYRLRIYKATSRKK